MLAKGHGRTGPTHAPAVIYSRVSLGNAAEARKARSCTQSTTSQPIRAPYIGECCRKNAPVLDEWRGALSGAAWLRRTTLATCLGARPTHTHSKAPMLQIIPLPNLPAAARGPLAAPRTHAWLRGGGGRRGPACAAKARASLGSRALGADGDLQSPSSSPSFTAVAKEGVQGNPRRWPPGSPLPWPPPS